MRDLVLELAVQGRLVDQIPAEGDGHALLNQIREKNLPPDTDAGAEIVGSELPNFPRTWAASKLGDVAEIIRGVSFPGSAKSATRFAGDVACLRTASVQAEIDWDDLIFIPANHVSRSDQWVAPNDIMGDRPGSRLVLRGRLGRQVHWRIPRSGPV
jgi:type I restriction enzyme, S subunit